LKAVLKGELTREEVSNWASHYVMADYPTIDDEIVWDFLKIICGIDLLDSPTSYLHTDEDINDWIKQAVKSIVK
jgi:hypothetical protein